jgi:hypothetical protein
MPWNPLHRSAPFIALQGDALPLEVVLQREFRGADPEHDCGMPGSARLVAAAQDNKVWIWKAYDRTAGGLGVRRP